jgi:hypothetical protein
VDGWLVTESQERSRQQSIKKEGDIKTTTTIQVGEFKN